MERLSIWLWNGGRKYETTMEDKLIVVYVGTRSCTILLHTFTKTGDFALFHQGKLFQSQPSLNVVTLGQIQYSSKLIKTVKCKLRI